MSYMTNIDGVPDRDQVKPGMAHFAGTGPYGQTCNECCHLNRRPTKNELFDCTMFKKLTGKIGNCIKRTYPACRYFEAKVVKKAAALPQAKRD